MKSRVSFFNFAVLRKNLQRCLPLIIIYTMIWTVAMPLDYLTRQGYYMRDDRTRYLFRDILEYGQNLGTVVAAVYALTLTMVIFSYLYNARSANMIHAFPIRREGLFVTNYVSGLVAFLGPNLFIVLASMLALYGKCSEALLQWFAMTGLVFIFCYSFAVFLAQLTGHIVALPIFYVILNFVVVVMELIFSYILPNWVYGMPNNISYTTSKFSPLLHIFSLTNCRYADDVSAYYDGWKYLIGLCAVGIAFAILAFLLYRKRRIECSGDAIAIPILRPVFKYCFSFGCAIVLGALIISVLGLNINYGNFLPAAICMIVGAFVGYFGSEMALNKKINVFTRGWVGFSVVCLIIAAIPLLCRIDAFGYSSYQPDRDDIVGVNFDYSCYEDRYVGDQQTIDTVYALHKELIENRPLYEDDLSDPALSGGNRTYQVRYLLKNGTVVLREYEFFITDNEWHLNYPLTERVEDLMNLTSLIQLHYCPLTKPTVNNIIYGDLDCYGIEDMDYRHFSLTARDALSVYEQAILPDILSGAICQTDYTFKTEDDIKYLTAEVNDAVPQSTAVKEEAHFSFNFSVVREDGSHEYVYFSISNPESRSFAAMKELAIKYEAMETE